ncbi:hypothetical protein SAMN05216566_12810 [Aureimonas phyllosphaerae]|nr:hypothetical protein SAMN05216566_12810 [Aureimonas phyllosphaerae]
MKEIGDTFAENRRTQIEDQYPDFKRITVQQCSSGHTLAVLAEGMDAFVFDIREGVPQEAAELAKSLFDWIDDHNAISADLPPSSRMTMRESLGKLVDEIQEAGAKLYLAQRSFELNAPEGDHIKWKIAYLTVFDRSAAVSEILVPRRICL